MLMTVTKPITLTLMTGRTYNPNADDCDETYNPNPDDWQKL